jgi:hypothetical protein
MGFKYTNNSNVSLPLAVWLMYDDYDYDGRTNLISATSLLKPTRALVLKIQNSNADKEVDIMSLVPSRMGSAIHAIAEQSWTSDTNIKNALTALGMTRIAGQFIVNPSDDLRKDMQESSIPVYVEQRHEKKVGDYIISGKYDLVLDGTLSDYKSTSVWTYIYDSNALKYTQQGSIYKWLAPDKITNNTVDIQFIFTDWSSSQAMRDSKYPQSRVITKSYPLWPVEQTDHYIKTKLDDITSLIGKSQEELPECTSEELWESETKYKYFKNPNKMARATKNYSSLLEAQTRMADDGNVGVINTVKGEVKACRYCEVSGICEQARNLIIQERLVL